MKKSFDRINAYYTKRRAKLLLDKKSQRPTKSGYWAASDPLQVFELFRKIKLENSKSFVDLGSGDGIVVAIASLFTKSTGIESDEKLHWDALKMRRELKLDCVFKNADYLDEDLSGYDLIFINPDNYFYKLEKKLLDEFKGKIVIVDNIFRPLTLEAKKQVSVRGATFSVYELK